eukprot:Rhum_TRINITY_DN14706_c5_g1::Rhum_TRINITY_DN14706_c5_g1_i1::g.111921::m.111921
MDSSRLICLRCASINTSSFLYTLRSIFFSASSLLLCLWWHRSTDPCAPWPSSSVVMTMSSYWMPGQSFRSCSFPQEPSYAGNGLIPSLRLLESTTEFPFPLAPKFQFCSKTSHSTGCGATPVLPTPRCDVLPLPALDTIRCDPSEGKASAQACFFFSCRRRRCCRFRPIVSSFRYVDVDAESIFSPSPPSGGQNMLKMGYSRGSPPSITVVAAEPAAAPAVSSEAAAAGPPASISAGNAPAGGFDRGSGGCPSPPAAAATAAPLPVAGGVSKAMGMLLGLGAGRLLRPPAVAVVAEEEAVSGVLPVAGHDDIVSMPHPEASDGPFVVDSGEEEEGSVTGMLEATGGCRRLGNAKPPRVILAAGSAAAAAAGCGVGAGGDAGGDAAEVGERRPRGRRGLPRPPPPQPPPPPRPRPPPPPPDDEDGGLCCCGCSAFPSSPVTIRIFAFVIVRQRGEGRLVEFALLPSEQDGEAGRAGESIISQEESSVCVCVCVC